MRLCLEHIMLIELQNWEMRELNALTNEIIEINPPTSVVGTGKMSFDARSYCFPYPTSLLRLFGFRMDFQCRVHRSSFLPDPNLPIPLPSSFHGVSLLTYISYITNACIGGKECRGNDYSITVLLILIHCLRDTKLVQEINHRDNNQLSV
jgi:hypothetical protein